MSAFRYSDYSRIIAIIFLVSIFGYPSTAISGLWIFKGWHPGHGPKIPGHAAGTPHNGLNKPDTDLNGPMRSNVPVVTLPSFTPPSLCVGSSIKTDPGCALYTPRNKWLHEYIFQDR